MEIKILNQEVDELMEIQEIQSAYYSLVTILRENKKIRDEFNFSDDQKVKLQEEFIDVNKKMMGWWKEKCNKYNLNPDDLDKIYIDYSSQVIRYQDE